MDSHVSRPTIPRDVYVKARGLVGTGQFEEALQALEAGSLRVSLDSTVDIFRSFGQTSLEEGNYELAYQAFMKAYLRAQADPQYGPAQLLGVLCESLEVSRLAAPQMCLKYSSSNREKLEQEIIRATSTPECTLSASTLTKVVMASGEVGTTFEMGHLLEEYLNSPEAGHLNSGANEGIFEMLYAHRCHLASILGSEPRDRWSTEAYQEAYRKLRDFPEYAPLRPYARLCLARVSAAQQDMQGLQMWLHEAAEELISLPPEARSPACVARILDVVAVYAVALPDLQHLFFKIYDRVDMPIHQIVRAYALWSEPSAVRIRLAGLITPEKQGAAIRDAESLVQQAEELSQGVVGIANEVRAQLAIAKAHLAAQRDDFKCTISALREGFSIAIADLRALDIVWADLVSLAWNPPKEIIGSDLVELWKEMLARPILTYAPDRFDVGELKCHVLVGLATALANVDYSLWEQAGALLEGARDLDSFFAKYEITRPIDISALGAILTLGRQILERLPISAERVELASALRALLQRGFDAPEALDEVEDEELIFFFQVEQAGITIFEALDESANAHAAQERSQRLQAEIDRREDVRNSLGDDSLGGFSFE